MITLYYFSKLDAINDYENTKVQTMHFSTEKELNDFLEAFGNCIEVFDIR